jgi:hypothetical protein
MPRFSALYLLLVLCLGGAASTAQTVKLNGADRPDLQKLCNDHQQTVRCQELVNEFFVLKQLLNQPPTATLDNPVSDTVAFISRIASRAIVKRAEVGLQTIAVNAAINQLGGSPTAAGSTNLVSKPTVTDFISAAAESGAFTDTISGTTMTIQANALGLSKYFANQPIFQRVNQGYADFLQPLSFTITLNVAQTGSSKAAATAGSATSSTPASITSILLPTNNASFSSFGVNYSIYRRYSPQSQRFLDDWKSAVNDKQKDLDNAGKQIATAVSNLFHDTIDNISKQSSVVSAFSQWHTAGIAAEQQGENSFDAFVRAFASYDDAFSDAVLDSSPDAPKNVLALSQALAVFNQVVYSVVNKARGTPLANLSYLYSSPPDKPATHDGTVAVSWLFRGGKVVTDPVTHKPMIDPVTHKKKKDDTKTFLSGAQLTANFTTSIYATVPTGAAYGRLRDLQISGEFDKPFGGTVADPRGTWSIAGYGQYQYDPTVLKITAGNLVPGTNIALPGDAQVLLGTAGWLGVVQGKVVINLKKGLTLPVALKWSNKTDLLKGNDVRGQFGLSYDLSALSKLVSGGSSNQ